MFFPMPRKIAVAVRFDELAPKLLRHACMLADSAGCGIHLTHVVEPPFVGISEFPLGVGGLTPELMTMVLDGERERAEGEMRALRQSLPTTLDVTHEVLATPFVTDAIVADAIAHGANLILCGVATKKSDGLPRGFSTAVSLMANARIPVMAIKETLPVDWDCDTFRILVADDLREAGRAALKFAIAISRQARGARLGHLHAIALRPEDFRAFMQAAMNYSNSPLKDTLHIDGLYKQIKDQMGEGLRKRAISEGLGETDPKLVYVPLVLGGQAFELICEEARKMQPHALVFGRHETIHRKPFSIGEIPFRSMLRLDCPVVVVPTPK